MGQFASGPGRPFGPGWGLPEEQEVCLVALAERGEELRRVDGQHSSKVPGRFTYCQPVYLLPG